MPAMRRSVSCKTFHCIGALGAASLMIFLWGCASGPEDVAKDWCNTIRAEQVIPVYPLTEDLMPGDVFLVQRSIANQQDDYKAKGFLPLDDHQHRFDNIQYSEMYFDGYWKDPYGAVPHARPATRSDAAVIATQPSEEYLTQITAPRAAFPSYTFTLTRGGGMGVAVPVDGIPIGFNYLAADKATGSVTLLDAHTYAADSYDLYSKLEQWADQPDVAQNLKQAAAVSQDKQIYLRVVTRVYLVGGVAVSLTRASNSGAQLTGGNAPAAQSITPDETDVLQKLSAASNLGKVGGQVNYTQASTLGVSMNETFDFPLVIGYLGFDVAVDSRGNLGPRIPTFDVLEHQATPPPAQAGNFTPEQQRYGVQQQALKAMEAESNGKTLVLEFLAAFATKIQNPIFQPLGAQATALLSKSPPPADFDSQVDALVSQFWTDSDTYVGQAPNQNYDIYSTAFDQAFTNSK
jgi:hypothetical protein